MSGLSFQNCSLRWNDAAHDDDDDDDDDDSIVLKYVEYNTIIFYLAVHRCAVLV